MNKWNGRNSILNLFFLLVAFIYIIKKEGSDNNIFTSAPERSPSCITQIIDYNPPAEMTPVLFSFLAHDTGPINFFSGSVLFPDHLTLKDSIHLVIHHQHNPLQISLPLVQILKVLRCQNIWHQAPADEPPALL
jgi:hypothetical protein